MSLIKGKYSKKNIQIGLFIFTVVLAVTFIQFRTLKAITVKGEKVYTNNNKTADIRLASVADEDKVYIVASDDKNKDTYKKLNSEPCDIKSDSSGKYITINKPSENNDNEYDMILAFNLGKDNNIASNQVTHVKVVVDTKAPEAKSVNIASSNIKTTLAKNGDIITLAFTTNEVVQTPIVEILGQTAKVTENESERGTSWKAEYTVKESDTTQDDVKFKIALKDLAGNVAPDVTSTKDESKVSCDNTAPTALAVSITNTVKSAPARTYAKNGDKITITFTTNEKVENPAATILKQNVDVKDIGAGDTKGTIWKAEYAIDDKVSTIPDGPVDFLINFKDVVGNEVTTPVIATTDTTKVTYDNAPTAKDVNIVSNNKSDSTYAKNGDKITLTFKTSKKVNTSDLDIPVVRILDMPAVVTDTDYKAAVDAGSDPQKQPGTAEVPGKGINWKAEYTIVAAEATIVQGQVGFSINFKDILGNEVASDVTSTTDHTKVTYDRTAPKAANVSITSSNNLKDYVKNGQTIIVSFTTDESIENMNATIFERPATNITGSGKNWKAEYFIPVGESTLIEGLVPFKIFGFNDLAGNVAADVTSVNDKPLSSVKYDRVVPVTNSVKLASNNKNTTQAKTGDTITVDFTTSEPIQKPEEVTILGRVVSKDNIHGNESGTSWKAEYTIGVTETEILEGDVEFTITFKDLACNNLVSTVIATTDKSSVNYESTIPQASTVSMVSSNVNPLFARNGDKVTVTFVTSKSVQKPIVKIEGRDALVTAEGIKANTWRAEYTIPTDESSLTEGTLPLSITLLDIANNETIIDSVTDSSTVTYDRTQAIASTVNIATSNNNPIYARNGDKITMTINTSEQVQKPVVTILGKTPIITETKIKDSETENGTSWIAEYTLEVDEKLIKEAQVDFSIDFKDIAGNNAVNVNKVTDKSIVNYDRTAAKATSVNIISTNSNPKYAKNGDKVTTKFTTSEVVQSPKVTIQGKTVAATGDGSGKNWTSQYTIAAREDALAEGNIGFSMIFKDLANNEVTSPVTSTNDSSSVNYDRTVPVASNISVAKVKGTSYSQVVKDGDEFKVKFTLADTNSGVEPSFVKTQVGKTSLTAPITKGTPKSGEYEAVFTVDDNTLLGIDDYASFNYVVNFRDVAGNSGLNINASAGITSDNIDPEIRFFINGVNTNSSELKPYYKDNKLMIQVKEHNFDAAQAVLVNSNVKQTSWEFKGNDMWQMVATLPDGDNYKLKVKVTDKAGNLRENDLTSVRLFNIDTTTPQIKYLFNGVQTDATSRYYKTIQQVAVQVTEHNFDPASTTVAGNGITKGSWKNKGNDIWEMSLTLGDANDYTLNVSTTDKALNKFEKNLAAFTVDTIKPALSIKNIMSGFFNGTLSPKVVYSDKNLDKNAVSIKFNGAELGIGTAVGEGFENIVNIKKDGKYDLVASATDLAGNPSTAEIQFVLDNTAPKIGSTTINLKDPIAFKGGWIIQKELQISDINGYDIVTCTLNGMDWDISKPITNEGKNVLYLEVKDKSGNMSKLTYQFFLDNTPPKLIVKDGVSNKAIDSSAKVPVFISQMNLKIALDKMEIGNEKPDYFASILLKDKDGNVISDILHSVKPKDENNLNVYYLPLSNFQTYTLSVMAKDQVGNDLNKTYTFTLKDKSIFKKYYDNKPLLYTTTSLATVLVIGFVGSLIIRHNKKKKVSEQNEVEEN